MLGIIPAAATRRVEVTCYSVSKPAANPKGIPYYLPKPMLVISKNFRYVADTDEGKSMGPAPIPSDKFDNQAQYADVKANVSTAPPSGSTGGTEIETPPPARKQTGVSSH